MTVRLNHLFFSQGIGEINLQIPEIILPVPFRNLSLDPAGIAKSNHIFRNIPGHNTARTDDCIISNGDTGQDHCIASNPDVPADSDFQ